MKEMVAKLLLSIKAVQIRPQEPFRYTSGILSPIYIDNRLIISYPEIRERVRDYFIECIQKYNISYGVIAGVATAGIAHAAFLADKLKAPMIYVRSSKKGHGKENQIEGKIEQGKQVLVIEDHISTGGSSINAIQAIKDARMPADYCLAITTYDMAGAAEKFAAEQCTLITLTDCSTLIETAASQGLIRKEDIKMVLDWSRDPSRWGAKHGFS